MYFFPLINNYDLVTVQKYVVKLTLYYLGVLKKNHENLNIFFKRVKTIII